jgi:hypothetical protein
MQSYGESLMADHVVPKAKYLTNKELLKAIHASKNTFCSYSKPEYGFYDCIVTDIGEINEDTINDAKQSRATRLSRAAHETAQLEAGKKIPAIEFEIDYHSISENDLIFRIMTFDHIPLHPERKKTVKTVADAHAKVNFPPFQHWKFNDIKELVCVGKSHWDGDLDTGRFSTSKGQMSNLLGKMLMKLAERYSSRSNVRGYTYVDEMRGQAVLQLTQVALQFDESKSSNPFSFYTQCCTNAFLRVINIEKRNREIRDDILEIAGLNPSHTRMNSDTYGEKMNDGYTWIDVD